MSMPTDSIVFFVKPFPLGNSKDQQNPLSNIRHKDFHLSFVLLFVFVAQATPFCILKWGGLKSSDPQILKILK